MALRDWWPFKAPKQCAAQVQSSRVAKAASQIRDAGDEAEGYSAMTGLHGEIADILGRPRGRKKAAGGG